MASPMRPSSSAREAAKSTIVTDGEGYFEISMKVPDGADWRGIWRPVDLRLLERNPTASTRRPSSSSRRRRAVRRDQRYRRHRDVHGRRQQDQNAVAAFRQYGGEPPRPSRRRRVLPRAARRCLRDEQNPMLYVSRAPWSIYEVLEDFFNLHKIPIGPVLFLREWGVTLQHPLPKQSKGHKNALIEDMLAVYNDLPFVLIGDSGQRDPEIYSRVVREHRSRVLAVYIRNVSRDAERIQAIETLATQVAEAGSSLVLAADSQVMASHAAERGLISPGYVASGPRRARASGRGGRDRTRALHREASPAETRQAVEEGELRETWNPPSRQGSARQRRGQVATCVATNFRVCRTACPPRRRPGCRNRLPAPLPSRKMATDRCRRSRQTDR